MNYKAVIKKQSTIIAISVICLTLVTIGVSYALFFQVEANSNNQVVTAGTLNVEYGSQSNAILSTEIAPMSDAEALNTNTMTGTIFLENTGTLPAKYFVKIGNDFVNYLAREDYDSENDALVSHDYIKVAAFLNGERVVEPTTLSSLSTSQDDNTMYELFSGILDTTGTGNSTATVVLKVWLDENAPTSVIGQYVYLKMDVTSEVEASLTGDFTRAIIANSVVSQTDINITDNNTSPNTTLYKEEDDLGTSYVYRGNVSNNYVTFAKEDENNYYTWRIVRINGDGTVRMVLDSDLGVESFRLNNQTDKKYAAYTYDNNVDSHIKSFLDNWYEEKLKDNYSKYIADEIFCNNRDEDGEEYFVFYMNSTISTLKCKKAYAYTVNNSVGNQLLRYPIGLISGEEAMYIGAHWVSGNYLTHYLNNGNSSQNRILTMTPVFKNSSGVQFAGVTTVNIDGYIDGLIKPVINLKADVKFTGSGTQADPYVIK